MKQRGKLLYIAVVCALTIPFMLAGSAMALTIGDGSKPNSAGLWDITDYGQCIAGIDNAGNMVVDVLHNKSRADCIDHVWASATPGNYDNNSPTTNPNCLKTSGRTGSAATDNLSHFFVGTGNGQTNTCVAADNTGINMDGLDRTAANCALKGGTWKLACVSSWIYTGSGTPNNPVLGNGAPGFCYTTIRLNQKNIAQCDNTILGYTWNTTNGCLYTYGVAGYANANIAKKDGSGNYAAAGDYVDLSLLTQGQCLYNGASWSTGVPVGTTASEATTPTPSTIMTGIKSTRAGCLECHNSVSQNNTYAERWKEPYLMHGHKNMLRKVTPGQPWAGPDSVIYTQAAQPSYSGGPKAPDYQALNFTSGTATNTFFNVDNVTSTSRTLMYIFGDWMAPAPDGLDTVVWRDDLTSPKAQYNGISNYSCAACHTTGWSNTSAGVCWPNNALTTQTACVSPNTWYPSTGIENATNTPAQPGASWPAYAAGDNTIPGITGRWDIDGVTCSRCHYAALSQVVPAPQFAFAGTNRAISTHNYTPAPTANHLVTNICFGCHQSIAKQSFNTAATLLDPNPVFLKVKNTATAPAYVPEFDGHVIGNSFLGSPHARFTGQIVPNVFGKFDVKMDNVGYTAVGFNSTFAGDVCKSNATYGSGSILSEVWDNVAKKNTRITSLELCNLANGFGTISSPDSTQRGFFQKENQGSCTTCHQVHESLFDPNAQEPLKAECTTCHKDKLINDMRHPLGAGTPEGESGGNAAVACEICHMPKATSGGFPMHLWRINSSASYSTFPDNNQFLGNTKKVANTAPDGSYTNAAWVGLEYACGQCHGIDGITAPKPGLPAFTKATLASFAAGIHGSSTANTPPTARFPAAGLGQTSYTVSFTDNSIDTETAQASLAVTVNWGDGGFSTGSGGGFFSHTYATAGTFPVLLMVQDAGGLSSMATMSVSVPLSGSITGNIWESDGTPFVGATIYLKQNGITKKMKKTSEDSSSSYNFTGLIPGNYTVQVYKAGMTFVDNATSQNPLPVTIGSSGVVRDFKRLSAKITVTLTSPLSGAKIYLKQNGVVKESKPIDTGNAVFTVTPGTYEVQAYKAGSSFDGNSGVAGKQNPITVTTPATVDFSYTTP